MNMNYLVNCMTQDHFDSLQNNIHVQLLRKPKISRTDSYTLKQTNTKETYAQNLILRSNSNVTITKHWLSAAASFCGLNLPFFLVNCLFNVM
jgi:S-methylmethionine-dependent homocysteine/selenocysteine methylase